MHSLHGQVNAAKRTKAIGRLLRRMTFILLALQAAPAEAGEHIHIVGSSTVFPFITAVAEEFGQKTRYPTPIVEQLGTGGGLKLFCSGLGTTPPFDFPDIATASRRIKQSEVSLCARNGVESPVEIKIGYDGIVFANAVNGPTFSLTLQQIYLALAAKIPANQTGKAAFVDNPYTRWNDVSADLPNLPIKVYGPPQTSGTRDALDALAIEAGCRTIPALQALEGSNPKAFSTMCRTFKDDQRYVEVGENDNLVIQKLRADPAMIGILPFSFLEQNLDVVKAAEIDATRPSRATISRGAYPIARSIFLYVKAAHARTVPGMDVFLAELFSKEAMGHYGYLLDKGLIPLSAQERLHYQAQAQLLYNVDPSR